MSGRARRVHPAVARAGTTRLFLWLAPRVLPRADRAVHRLTGGRWMPSRLFLPSVVLTTTGHRSGRPHATPLCAFRCPDGSRLVAATNFGRPRHPHWSANLLHRPEATVTYGGRTQPVTAHRLSPAAQRAERARSLAILPAYDHYAARVGDRGIRVFRLVP
ncbi:nitroreductase family deazaflavin-dependent oxidoreductase [Streptomyces cinnamoneus]|uniref:Nitroreductase family deazaflavin-dependent oxidoreductase n=1 Tax=Streptomyces cinnamoneus TaxID=53446 RepID=A0A2G1XMN9_STRCJ|nr:nitroreductase family deazaflavin-dependent oxidoreductase [Streptomyces cinnamoneus]PHQ52473.1 nitroreductase family deazaflavin-dependent oxidoreductase [Streptomyces cinnamoneus]PPT16006.1 nitroreductase family deazaflavin-dependent oxidoreductase [Streptomyces cinnamoneus]